MITAVFARISSASTEMQVRLNKRDLPDCGVHIITALDPSFDSIARKHFQNELPETLKPFAVFVQNSGNRMLVAYVLTWKFVKEDGKVTTKSMGYSEPGILMGNEIPTGPGFKHTTAIEPQAVRCFSWDRQIEPEGKPVRNTPNQPPATPIDNSSLLRALLANELSNATDVTVSVDGVVFDDGTFVGSNLVFFQQLQAAVNAKIDLLHEIVEADEQGKLDQALERINSKSQEPDVTFSSEFSAEEYYRYFRKLDASEITGLNRAYGREKLVPHLLKSYRRARPIHRKD